MDIKDLIKLLGPTVGQKGVDALNNLLTDLSDSEQEPWKKTALNLIAQAVAAHGPQGVALALTAINDALGGKVPVIDWADLRTASDVLAQMQLVEAGNKSAVKDFLVKVSNVLGIVLSGILQGLL